MVFGGCLIICMLLVLGVWHGKTLIDYKRLQDSCGDNCIISPNHIILLTLDQSKYMQDLAQRCIQARKKAHIQILKMQTTEDGRQDILFENGDILSVITYGAQIAPLNKRDIGRYTHRFFFDYKLPAGAERAIIKDLGLLDYVLDIGICTEKSGG